MFPGSEVHPDHHEGGARYACRCRPTPPPPLPRPDHPELIMRRLLVLCPSPLEHCSWDYELTQALLPCTLPGGKDTFMAERFLGHPPSVHLYHAAFASTEIYARVSLRPWQRALGGFMTVDPPRLDKGWERDEQAELITTKKTTKIRDLAGTTLDNPN